MDTPEVKQTSTPDDEAEEEEAEPMDVDEFEEMTAPPAKQRDKTAVLKKAFGSLTGKIRLTDRRLAQFARYTEYLMVGFITLAVASVVVFGAHFALVGLAVPYMAYLQVFLGSIVSAFGLFIMQIILEGGTEYLASLRQA